MTYKTPSSTKKHCESTEPESRPTAKMLFFFSFLLFLFVSFFIQACSKLCDFFTMVFMQSTAFYTEQHTHPLLFYNFEVLWGTSNQSRRNFGFICKAISSLVHMHTKHLATKRQDHWFYGVCGNREKIHHHCWLSVWQMPGQWLFSKYCIGLLRSMWGQMCCSVIPYG